MIDLNYYEVVAVSYELRKRKIIASDLTSDEADETRRQYVNRNGLTARIDGRTVPAQIHIYRQKRPPREFVGDKEVRND